MVLSAVCEGLRDGRRNFLTSLIDQAGGASDRNDHAGRHHMLERQRVVYGKRICARLEPARTRRAMDKGGIRIEQVLRVGFYCRIQIIVLQLAIFALARCEIRLKHKICSRTAFVVDRNPAINCARQLPRGNIALAITICRVAGEEHVSQGSDANTGLTVVQRAQFQTEVPQVRDFFSRASQSRRIHVRRHRGRDTFVILVNRCPVRRRATPAAYAPMPLAETAVPQGIRKDTQRMRNVRT